MKYRLGKITVREDKRRKRFQFVHCSMSRQRQAKSNALALLLRGTDDYDDDDNNDLIGDLIDPSEDGEIPTLTVNDVTEDAIRIQDDEMDRDTLVTLNESDNDSSSSSDEDDGSPMPQRIRTSVNSATQGLKAPSGRIWTTDPPNVQGRVNTRNILTPNHDKVKRGIYPSSEMEALLMFADDLIETALRFSNLHGRRLVAQWNSANPQQQRSWQKISEDEMNAFIGLHLYCAAYRDKYQSTDHMWSSVHGRAIYKAVMSEKRFKLIKRCFRLDDPNRRDRADKLAPVRVVFENFLSKLPQFVNAPEKASVDEQLLEYHGKVFFKQYIGTKPGKFGMKIFWLTNSAGTYAYNGLVYIGANTLSREKLSQASNFSEAVVMHLCEPIFGSGANVTGDNYFSSSSLVEKLSQKQLSYIGTIRDNRKDVPPLAKATSGRRKGDTVFLYTNDHFMCSFWDKRKKPVLLLDSFANVGRHQDGCTKPDTVNEYNATKSGVDNLDKLIRMHSMKRRCRRWPYGFAMNLLDVCVINGMFVFKKTRDLVKEKIFHYEFLLAAGRLMVQNHLQQRMRTAAAMQPEVKQAFLSLGFMERNDRDSSNFIRILPTQQRCHMCSRKEDRKSKFACSLCSRPVCNVHRCSMCSSCH